MGTASELRLGLRSGLELRLELNLDLELRLGMGLRLGLGLDFLLGLGFDLVLLECWGLHRIGGGPGGVWRLLQGANSHLVRPTPTLV